MTKISELREQGSEDLVKRVLELDDEVFRLLQKKHPNHNGQGYALWHGVGNLFLPVQHPSTCVQ